MKNRTDLTSYFYLAGAMFISGSAIVIGKIMVGSLPTYLATESGLAIGLLFLMPLLFLVKKEPIETDPRTNVILLSQALCGVAFYRIFTFWGLQSTTAATSGLITSATPAIVALLAFLLLKEKLKRQQIGGILLTVLGLAIINLAPIIEGTGAISGSIKGNLLILAAALCEALFSILSKADAKPVSALYRTTLVTFYAFLCLLPFSIYDGLHYEWSRLDHTSVLCALYYGFFVSFLSYVLWFKGIARTAAADAADFTGIVPASSILLAAVILEEPILPVHVVGLICMIAGILSSFLRFKRDTALAGPRRIRSGLTR